jgi:alkaline phosphatase
MTARFTRSILLFLCTGLTMAPARAAESSATDNDPWFKDGQARLQWAESVKPITGRARNVIVFLGDGMGVATVTAARILDGQRKGGQGEDNVLSFETFPYAGLSKTYTTDNQIGESAGTITAIMTGVKTASGVIGVKESAGIRDVDGKPVAPADCGASEKLTTALEYAEMDGMATGVVTTTRLTHATPAGTYAHVSARDWESDADIAEMLPDAHRRCKDIAAQLIDFPYGDGIEVAMGGGRTNFIPWTMRDPESTAAKPVPGRRLDGRDLTKEWRSKRKGAVYVWNAKQLAALDPAKTGPVLGLFEPSHMQYEADRAFDIAGEPSLSEMTAFAIRKLAAKKTGFFLLVEGGRIDHANHAGNAYRALTDTIEFAKAVKTAMDLTEESDTLIVVTADHSHTLTISGYAPRGNPILGLAKRFDPETGTYVPVLAADGKPYTTLGYANGPGAVVGPRADLTSVDTEAKDFKQQALVPVGSETHGGEDVPVYARGPKAYLLTGVFEQNYIFHVMDAAAGLRGRARR